MLKEENTNLLKQIRFLESKHHSLLKNYNAFTQEIKSNKSSSFVNNIFHPRTKVMGNEIKLIRNLEVNQVLLSYHLGLNKSGWEMIRLNVKLCSMLLKLNLPMSGTLIVVALNTWQETKPFSHLLRIIMVGWLLLEMGA